jgi:hypothetical protein
MPISVFFFILVPDWQNGKDRDKLVCRASAISFVRSLPTYYMAQPLLRACPKNQCRIPSEHDTAGEIFGGLNTKTKRKAQKVEHT